MQLDDVCWRPYEEHREIQDFEEVFWYSGWIMCGVRRVYRHLSERVLRQYGYVQTIPRHPTDVRDLPPPSIVQMFVDFRTHTLKADARGEQAGEDTWRVADGYVLWYTRVSHPQILPPIPGDLLRPANEEQIIAEQWQRYEARNSPDTYDMVSGAVAYADAQLGQEEVMSMTPQQSFEAITHMREQIAPILTRRRAQRPRRRHHHQDQDQLLRKINICSGSSLDHHLHDH
uniref:IMP dehydrogenase/GMP reductase, putative n=1 Tax=Medicago truncatula TaxID=3880 RepID=A2Q1N2_MEDTR|nr:IMP dehydrogenase/GMP reductase, putative [Medicago truncatula]